MFEKNKNNCLEYTKVVNQLRDGAFNPFGDEAAQEELMLMQAYVFGNQEIPKCKTLGIYDLKPTAKPTVRPTQKTTDDNGDIIGYFDSTPVYKKKDSIIVNNDIYNQLFQPKQNSFDNKLIRYFLMYEGGNKMRFEDKKLIGYNQKKFVGWVDYDVINGTYKFEKYTTDQSIPGLNFFGSVYIGDNNPTNANGTPNYDIPTQDEIDNGAKQHDICYDILGLKGKDGVFGSEGLHCDNDFAALCLKALNLKDMASFAVSSLPKHACIITGLFDYYKGDRHLTLNMLSNEVFKPRNARDRAMLVLELFSATSAKKAYQNTAEEVFEKVLIKDKTYKVTFRKNTTLFSTSDGQFEVQPDDVFEGEMKDGKVIQGKVIRNSKTVRIFLDKHN